MAEDELVRRILDEADMAARPGQYDRLVAIANEVAALREQIDGDPHNWVSRATARDEAARAKAKVLADVRAKVSRLTGRRPGDGTVWRADVLALIEEANHG